MRATGIIDSFVIPMRNNHVGGTAKKEDFTWLGNLTDFFVSLIGWPDHLFVGSVREDNVPAFIADKKFTLPQF